MSEVERIEGKVKSENKGWTKKEEKEEKSPKYQLTQL
jgi:hypothetical protein